MLVDRRVPAGRLGFLRNGLDALGVAPHECDLDPFSGDLDRGGAADAASSPREQDEGQVADSTTA